MMCLSTPIFSHTARNNNRRRQQLLARCQQLCSQLHFLNRCQQRNNCRVKKIIARLRLLQICKHLLEVDDARPTNPYTGATRWSVRQYIQYINSIPDNPTTSCILFGEDGYFPQDHIEDGPIEGYILTTTI